MKLILIAVALIVGVVVPPTSAQAADGPSVTATVTVGSAPWGVAFSPDGALAYVGNSDSPFISVIDIGTKTVSNVSTVVGELSWKPAGIAIKPDGQKVIATATSSVSTIGLVPNSSVSTAGVSCIQPLAITMAGDGVTAYVGCLDGKIQAVNTDTLDATALLPVQEDRIEDIAFFSSSSVDYLAYLNNVISGTSGGYLNLMKISDKARTRTQLPGFGATPPGYGLSLAVNSSATRAYVGDENGGLSVFDISNPGINPVLQHTINVGGEPRGIALSADGALAHVTDKRGNSVKVVDLATRSVTHTVDVGIGPQRIAISPDGRTALVTNNGTNTVSLLTLIPETALTPVFAAPVSTASGFTVNVSNYDPAFTWTPSVDAGSVTAGSATGSTLPVTITGLTAGQSATLTMGTARSGYSAGSATVSGAAQSGAALTPVFAAPVSTASGFTVNVSNYDPAFTWTPSVDAGFVTAGSATGSTLPVTITGLTAGQSATLTMGTARSGYSTGSMTVNGAALPAPSPPTPGPPAPPAPVPELQPSPTVSPEPVATRPSAPRDIAVAEGDGRAVLTWLPPLVGGSGSQMNYVVEAKPGGEVCSTMKTTCVVENLVNGTTYTFAVRASDNAGLGPWSAESAAVTPAPQKAGEVVIRGHKKKVRDQPGLVVRGVSTGLLTGTILRPWLRFQGTQKFIRGSARVRVDETGAFQWQRRIRRDVSVVMRQEDGNVRSNVISIQR